jgi:quinol monooxygenase YgiN
MATFVSNRVADMTDRTCTAMPYFEIPARHLEQFKTFCDAFIAKTAQEPKCLYYGFSFNGSQAHCRETYVDAQGLLDHLGNIAELNRAAFHLASIVRYEVHGPREELDKLREPLAFMKPLFFEVQHSYCRTLPVDPREGLVGQGASDVH